MRKFKQFFATKGFYVALTLGVVFFAVLVGAYEYRENKKKFLDGNQVDLNAPAVETDTKKTSDTNSKTNANDLKNQEDMKAGDKKINNAKEKDNAKKTKNETTENTNTNIAQEKNSDEADSAVLSNGIAAYDGDSALAWPLIYSEVASAIEGEATISGHIVKPYSMDTTIYFETLGVYKCNPGVMLSASEGENVYAVYSGEVTKIEDTKEFGTVITMDIGNGYIVKYGQLMNVTVKEGDVIAIGENIAEVAPVTAYYEKEGNHLYLAMTKDGIPLNPVSLIE